MDAFDCCTHISLNLLEVACDQGVLCSFYITTAYNCTSTVCDGSYLVYFYHYRCILVYSVTLRALFQSTYWPENVTSSDDLRCRSGNHTPCAVPPHAQSHLPWPRVHANNFSHTNPLPRRNTNRVMKQACTFLIKVSAQCAGLQFIEPNDAF